MGNVHCILLPYFKLKTNTSTAPVAPYTSNADQTLQEARRSIESSNMFKIIGGLLFSIK